MEFRDNQYNNEADNFFIDRMIIMEKIKDKYKRLEKEYEI